MGKLVKVRLNDIEVWMETANPTTVQNAPQLVSNDKLAEETLNAAESLGASIKAYCSALVRTFEALEEVEKPQRITAEFGLKLSSDCKFYIINAAGEASLKITAQWETSKSCQ